MPIQCTLLQFVMQIGVHWCNNSQCYVICDANLVHVAAPIVTVTQYFVSIPYTLLQLLVSIGEKCQWTRVFAQEYYFSVVKPLWSASLCNLYHFVWVCIAQYAELCTMCWSADPTWAHDVMECAWNVMEPDTNCMVRCQTVPVRCTSANRTSLGRWRTHITSGVSRSQKPELSAEKSTQLPLFFVGFSNFPSISAHFAEILIFWCFGETNCVKREINEPITNRASWIKLRHNR